MTETPARPTRVAAWIGQGVLYAAFALFIGVFSHWPSYQHLGSDQALIKVSFTHTGKPVGECRTLGEAELAGCRRTCARRSSARANARR